MHLLHLALHKPVNRETWNFHRKGRCVLPHFRVQYTQRSRGNQTKARNIVVSGRL